MVKRSSIVSYEAATTSAFEQQAHSPLDVARASKALVRQQLRAPKKPMLTN